MDEPASLIGCILGVAYGHHIETVDLGWIKTGERANGKRNSPVACGNCIGSMVLRQVVGGEKDKLRLMAL